MEALAIFWIVLFLMACVLVIAWIVFPFVVWMQLDTIIKLMKNENKYSKLIEGGIK